MKSTLHSESKCWGLFGSAKYLLALKGAGVFPDCPRSAVSRGRVCFAICGECFPRPSVHGFFDRQACYIRFPVGGLCLLNTVLSFTVQLDHPLILFLSQNTQRPTVLVRVHNGCLLSPALYFVAWACLLFWKKWVVSSYFFPLFYKWAWGL